MIYVSLVCLIILQIFSPEVTLNHDQVLITVGSYDPWNFNLPEIDQIL